jgi:hypothetical protein
VIIGGAQNDWLNGGLGGDICNGRGGVDVAWGCAVAPNVEASIFPDQTLGAVQASQR